MRSAFSGRVIVAGVMAIGISACAGDTAEDATVEMEEAPPAASVSIVEPQQGATVTGPDVNVVFQVDGVEIAPIAEAREGTGHHHLYIDTDPGPASEPIPVGLPGVVHLGGGQVEYLVQGLEPGEHRFIAVVADLYHVPLNPPVTDTVVFTVAAPAGM